MKKLVLFSGVQRSGKTYGANTLAKIFEGQLVKTEIKGFIIKTHSKLHYCKLIGGELGYKENYTVHKAILEHLMSLIMSSLRSDKNLIVLDRGLIDVLMYFKSGKHHKDDLKSLIISVKTKLFYIQTLFDLHTIFHPLPLSKYITEQLKPSYELLRANYVHCEKALNEHY